MEKSPPGGHCRYRQFGQGFLKALHVFARAPTLGQAGGGQALGGFEAFGLRVAATPSHQEQTEDHGLSGPSRRPRAGSLGLGLFPNGRSEKLLYTGQEGAGMRPQLFVGGFLSHGSFSPAG